MKKTVYILADDLLHPANRLLPLLPRLFDYGQWHVCVLKHWEHICSMDPPDLIVNFKEARDNWRLETPSWYEQEFSCRIADFVTRSGCGYLAVHAGLLDIPADHPLLTKVLKGSVVPQEGKPPFSCNQFFGRIPGLPFGLFSRVTFHPGSDHPVTAQVPEFTITDEQYLVRMVSDENVQILGTVSSEEAGESIAAWAVTAGQGRAVGIAMGHLQEALLDPAMLTLLKNAISWCTKEEGGNLS